MRIHRLKLILIAASILALGAGVFAGMAVSRIPASTAVVEPMPAQQQPEHASIADSLGLTDAQRDQMRSIWEGVRTNVHQTFQEAQTIQKDRDDAVVAMLTDSQKARYAALTQQAAEKFAALSSQRDQAFRDGVDKTRKILNDSQRLTYDRIMHDRVGASPEAVGGAAANGGGSGLATSPSTANPSLPSVLPSALPSIDPPTTQPRN
jgi:Spy/CpxP family protein refolding chaperone